MKSDFSILLAYGTYDAMTVEAIRALNDRNDKLNEKVTSLESENKQLRNRLEMLEAAVYGLVEDNGKEGGTN